MSILLKKNHQKVSGSMIKDGISDGFEGVLYYSGIVLTILIASIIFSPVIFYSIRLIKSIIVRLKNKNIKSVT
jgi:hypothetical protein